jgi:hypothetical protein
MVRDETGFALAEAREIRGTESLEEIRRGSVPAGGDVCADQRGLDSMP